MRDLFKLDLTTMPDADLHKFIRRKDVYRLACLLLPLLEKIIL